MKIEVVDERVFPTLGITASAGDTVDVVHENDVPSKKAVKATDVKDGDTNGIAKE